MANIPEKFTGFQVNSAETWQDFKKQQFDPKPFGDYDVDIKIECCGVCASDVHTVKGDWGAQPYPLAVGHEIVGKALRVGPKVTKIKAGERVGVGAQSYACLDCRQCKNDNETYCKEQLDTYGSTFPDSGAISQGGYSSHVRTHEHWVFPIPEALPSTLAAPMLCAGLTAYSPLIRNGCGPGKKVGIVGIGGIGHFGVMFAKALGAEVWAISRSRSKEADSLKMGADGYLASGEKGWNEPHQMTFDLILNTANSFEGFDLSAYLSLLDVHGKWVSVGLPGGGGITVRNQDFLPNGCFIGSSHLGSRRETLEMLQLAADKGIKTWVQEVPISEDGLRKAMNGIEDSSVRYRYCLTNYEEAFGQ
ncbi:zinc-binding protein [Colletotrichum kahawae]|uniref:alcohol dehydrogenase (NADP(+)) n=1 Tax=Colletotrichum kahawae TaxID=34407 RepID=A0AAD9Y4U9_COLKA|nr:zinc-binding protein [Colletotrichum kahawae]